MPPLKFKSFKGNNKKITIKCKDPDGNLAKENSVRALIFI